MENENERIITLGETARFKSSNDSANKGYLELSQNKKRLNGKSNSVEKFDYRDGIKSISPKTKNSSKKRTNSSNKKNKDEDLNVILERKKSITTIKNTLYNALKNINKELNVKIENKEQNKASFSLRNFINKRPEESRELGDTKNKAENNYFSENDNEDKISSEYNSEEIKNTIKDRLDPFTRKMSKKVDLESVLGNLVNLEKLPKILNNIISNEIITIENKEILKIEQNTEFSYIHSKEIQNNTIDNPENLNFNLLSKKINYFDDINITPFNENNNEILSNPKHKEIMENLIQNNLIIKSKPILNNVDNVGNNYLLMLNTSELFNFINIIKSKDDEISVLQNIIEKSNKEIITFKSETESNKNVINLYQIKRVESEKEFKFTIDEFENKYKSLQNHSQKLEQENINIKKELNNVLQYKNVMISKMNEDLNNMGKLSEEFLDNFISTDEEENNFIENNIDYNNEEEGNKSNL